LNVLKAAWGVIKIIAGLGVCAAIGFLAFREIKSEEAASFSSPRGTPPPEYVYLDESRVQKYLAQLEGGASLTATVTEQETLTSSAKLTAKDIAEVSRATEAGRSIVAQLTPAPGDRFYELLKSLQSGRYQLTEQSESDEQFWLRTVDVRLSSSNTVSTVRCELVRSGEGQFIRIFNARLSLPEWAAFSNRVRYVLVHGSEATEGQYVSVSDPVRPSRRRAIRRYLKRLKGAPLPFVVKTYGLSGPQSPCDEADSGQSSRPSTRSDTSPGIRETSTGTSETSMVDFQEATEGVVFLIPSDPRWLSSDPYLLGGRLTILGKIVHVDPRAGGCKGELLSPCSHTPRDTVRRYVAALQKEGRRGDWILSAAAIEKDKIAATVRRAMRFDAPVAVVLPLAIYQ
jgi:hypothetical protein